MSQYNFFFFKKYEIDSVINPKTSWQRSSNQLLMILPRDVIQPLAMLPATSKNAEVTVTYA